MHIELGLGELLASITTGIGAIWVIVKIAFGQFERRLNEKFTALDGLLLDVKKLEIEQVKRDAIYANQFVHKEEFKSYADSQSRTIERVFGLLTQINDKLDRKVDKEDCDKLMIRKDDRQ